MNQDHYVWPPTLRLEGVAREIAAEWGGTLGRRFALSRFGYAAPLGEHVLKVTPPEDDQADLERTARRIDAFAAAGLDRDRLCAWAVVRGVTWDLPFEASDPLRSRAFAVVRDLAQRG